MSDESKGVWATVGKVSVVIALLLGLIQLFKYVSTDGPSLQVQGSHYPIYYSPKVFEKNMVSPETAGLYFPYEMKDREKASKAIADEINRKLLEKQKLDSYGYTEERVVEINITNTGNREGQDLRIEFPTSGYYEVNRVGEALKRDNFDRVIPLGNVRSNNTISLRVWPKNFSELNEDKVIVTHTLGATTVDFAMPINGWMAVPWRYSGVTVFLGLIFFLFFLLALGAAFDKKKPPTETTVKEESPPEEKPTEEPASPA